VVCSVTNNETMKEDLIDFNLPEYDDTIISVIGVGGGGTNAVNRMYDYGIKDVDFFVTNTDAQALALSQVPVKIQLGETLTEGRGAGNRAAIGEQAAIESADKIRDSIKPSTKMAFVVAGMGGGTGTGATPVIARICRDMDILTVAVVTLPFRFEGPLRMKQAIQGINRLKQEVDALLIIHNEKLREIYGNLTLSNAFGNADNILMLAVKGIAEIITMHGYVNVDFADVVSVMSGGGIAFMGSATASGPDRAREVIERTINSPLLNNNDIRGASRVLLNIASGKDEITVDEIGSITDTIIDSVQGKVNTIWGTCTDESLESEIRITLVATGFNDDSIPELLLDNPPKKQTIVLSGSGKGSLFPDNITESIQETAPENDDARVHISEEISDNDLFRISSVPEVSGTVDPLPGQDLKKPKEEPDTQEKRNAARLKAFNYQNFYDSRNIDELEKTPAYKRKNVPVQPEIFPKEEFESRYTVGGKDARLRANNSYLHDAVD